MKSIQMKDINLRNSVIKKMALMLLLLFFVFSILGCERHEPKYELVKPLYNKTLSKMNSSIDSLTDVTWNDRADRFYYSQLPTAREKLVYLFIEKESEEYREKIELFDIELDSVWDVIAAVWADNPDLFWIYDAEAETFGYEGDRNKIRISFKVPENIEQDMNEIERVADSFIASIPEDATNYEKVKLIFDWIGDYTEYETGDRDQDIRSVFIDAKSVCAGFANSFQYICNKLNIPCACVTGWAERDYIEDGNEYHEWNIVKIDGKTYWVDPTWGDSFLDEYGRYWPSNYNYLCMSDDDVEGIYRIDKKYRNFGGTMTYEYPKCPDDDLDYYRHMSDEKDMYFSEYDYEKVVEYIKNKFYSGETTGIALQFANEEDFQDLVTRLLDWEDIFEIIWEVFPDYWDASVDSVQDNDFLYLCISISLG